MRQRNMLIPTLREIPAEAEAASHKLMLRGGFIRPLAAGIYTYLPTGWRVLRKIERIIREEMDRTGAQELLMPAMQPTELWQQSERYNVYGPELIRLHDRNQREFALGPTHEEVVTSLIRDTVSSYRSLPMTVYQIQTKFRDERRPRFGLLRGREFIMKDAYSFAMDWESLDSTYQSMYEAYHRIFTRCGLRFRSVEADAGSIGGEGETHEFMALAEIGEDTVVVCSSCGYAANLEKAVSAQQIQEKATSAPSCDCEKFATPGIKTIDQLVHALGITADTIIKTLVYVADGQPVAIAIRGDHEVNELKVKQWLQAEALELSDEWTIQQSLGGPAGYIGPVGLPFKLLVDHSAAQVASGVAGANEADYHVRNVVPGRDFPLNHVGDFRNVKEGEGCPHCASELKFHRGIEIGHVFKLGTKYSDKLKAETADAAGRQTHLIMGCYGIGVSRLLSAIVEQYHDEQGITWPASIAPFQVHLIPVSTQDEVQRNLAESLYQQLSGLGIEVLMDDREERPGVKFKDADLIGIPIRLVIGKKAVDGLVEYKTRSSSEQAELTVEAAVDRILKQLANV
ncbi:proline--tRNA ligase [Paenibacillus sp. UNC451MF]|uniref:proline--tRNA ligase n=1 Tax=Paenibacillus sp. UNC451MF TaxID=1449063 RepID=UPI00048EF9AB|nr:proline--tRNA ligase [Paenibacillus sp. UNC451MF]